MTVEVSVVIPYFRHGRHLAAAVQSARMATRRPLEILIVDDGADEPGAARHLRHAEGLDAAVRVIRQPNAGLSAARNTGLEAAVGDYVQFLDSDDLLHPGKIDLQIAQLAARPGMIGSVSGYAVGDPDTGVLRHDHDTLSRFPLTPDSFLFRWERGFSVPIHTALFRRSALDGVRFDTRLRAKEDWIFWLDLLRRHPAGLGHLPVLGAVYRTHAAAMTRGHAEMGEAFDAAARRIASVWGADYPDFASASAAWRALFYAEGRAVETPPASPGGPHDLARLRRVNLARRRRLEARASLGEPPEQIERLDAETAAALLARYRSGRRIVFDDAGRDLPPDEALRVRALNGLFDQIRVGDDTAAVLAGALWSTDILSAPARRLRAAA